VPEGWRVGDELFLPDLRQVNRSGNRVSIRRESPLTVAAIDGDVITLSKPLDFEHRSILDPDGQVVARPRVANLARNIVIRSENPNGTRGHTVNTGAATWDIRYNRLIALGRTRAEKLDSTKADPETGEIAHVGTNQIARYASHDHHVHAHVTRRPAQGHSHQHADTRQFVGNVLDGDAIGKWGHVVHGTHDTRVEENIAIGFAGAGFVTEDGYEVRNVFRRNVAIGSAGNGIGAPGNIDARRGHDCPGCEGAGFWFRGLHQVIEENEAWNNAIGINLFAMGQVTTAKVPEKPGAKAESVFDPRRAVPVAFSRNVTLSNADAGLEYWSTPRFAAEDHLSAHNGLKQMFAGASANINVYLVRPTLVASGGLTDGVASSEAYVQSLEVDGGRIVGCRQAFQRGGAREFLYLRNLTLQCVMNINFVGRSFADESVYENVVHKRYADQPPRYVLLGPKDSWRPGDKVVELPARMWVPARGSRHIVKNWQGTGQDYRLYENQQLASAPAWPANGAYGTSVYCPEDGLTMGECWQRYGLAYGGGVVPDDVAVQLEGLVHGVARPGLNTTLGVPRAVVTTPNMLAPATVRSGNRDQRVRLRIILTGDPARANRVAVVKVDDDRPRRCVGGVAGAGQLEDEASCDSDAVSPGTHTVKTWREDESGRKIPESELVFRYYVSNEPPETQPRGMMSRSRTAP
jgi:hypothetical protein